MKISTARFGDIDIAQEKTITFPEGIPGFDDCRGFALVTTEETEPFSWLQSMEQPEISFAVINPFRLFSDYAPSIPLNALADIGSPEDEDVLLLSIAVIPKDIEGMSTNLASPILINAEKNLGKQVILDNTDYQIRQPIFEPVALLLNGGEQDAGSDPQA